MREIKFRAWDKEKNFMYRGGYVGCDSEGLAINEFNESMFETILMQYTGLKDKNGKEIYEGDILKWQDSKDVLEVRWIDASWQVHGSYNRFASHSWENSEVIGNIHETPHLLEVK